jgi:hypothetical protein
MGTMRWLVPIVFLATAAWLQWEAGAENATFYTLPMLGELMPDIAGDPLKQQDMTRNIFAVIGLGLIGTNVLSLFRQPAKPKMG